MTFPCGCPAWHGTPPAVVISVSLQTYSLYGVSDLASLQLQHVCAAVALHHSIIIESCPETFSRITSVFRPCLQIADWNAWQYAGLRRAPTKASEAASNAKDAVKNAVPSDVPAPGAQLSRTVAHIGQSHAAAFRRFLKRHSRMAAHLLAESKTKLLTFQPRVSYIPANPTTVDTVLYWPPWLAFAPDPVITVSEPGDLERLERVVDRFPTP